KLSEHCFSRDAFFIVVLETLMPRDVADRMQRGSAYLPRSFSDVVSHRKDLVRLLVQQQMIIAKISSGHVPVKVLGFDIQSKNVGKQLTKVARNLLNTIPAETRACFWGLSFGLARLGGIDCSHLFSFSFRLVLDIQHSALGVPAVALCSIRSLRTI